MSRTITISAHYRGKTLIPEHTRTYKPGSKIGRPRRKSEHGTDLRKPPQNSVLMDLINKEKELREEIEQVRKGIELVNQLKQIAKNVGVR